MRGFVTTTAILLCLISQASAQDIGSATAEKLSDAYTGKAYSPYAKRSFPDVPLWGETHLHTSWSVDARAFGNTLGPRDAYRAARGDEVISASGQAFRLSRPLDWVVIADHTDAMGLMGDIIAGNPEVTKFEQGARWSRAIGGGGPEAVEATLEMIGTFAQGQMDPGLIALFSPGSRRFATIWEDCIQAAEEFNDPGTFTALIGFEWSSLVKGGNMHRNVIFRDGADRVRQIVPLTTQPPIGSTDPLDLYKYLEDYEARTNGAVLATAHNGNLSNGIMFPVDAQYTGRKLDAFYVEQREKWERMYEIVQNFGDGEAHPYLSPNDEFADFGTWDLGNLDLSEPKAEKMLQYEYAREALKNGLALEAKLGTNPYKFGIQGATDLHTSLPSAEEDNFFGKHTGYEPSPERLIPPLAQTENGVIESWQQLAAGLTAVWSKENTRESIFDAMDRKEVYATTGPRIPVRFFGGWDFSEQDLTSRYPAFAGYDKGVPMGGDLANAPDGQAPTFMVYAIKDPIGANLDRIQIIKGWLDETGATQEEVYDVVWSGVREPNDNGTLPAIGNTVDMATASWTNTIGSAELGTVWTDPDFDQAESAFYYARVLEIPTPPWYVYDAFRYGVELPAEAPTSHQERAYTTPIWYTPG